MLKFPKREAPKALFTVAPTKRAIAMPVSMAGSPLPVSPPSKEDTDDNFLPFGSFPHQVPHHRLIFDPMRGGWVQPDANRAGQGRFNPPHWDLPAGKAKREPHHFEEAHQGKWQLDSTLLVPLRASAFLFLTPFSHARVSPLFSLAW